MSTRFVDAESAVTADARTKLLDILDTHNVYVPDEDGTPIRTWGVEFVPAAHDTVLVEKLLALIATAGAS